MNDGYVLIVGGAGYIGSHLTKELYKKGYDVIVVDNLSNGHIEFAKWGIFIPADIGNKEQLRLIFKKYKITAVLHFAALIEVGESVIDPEKYYYNNVSYTLNLLSVMKEFNVMNFIFSSTCATYGEPQYIPLDEKHSQAPINPYGASKFMVEQMVKDFHSSYGMNYAIPRYFNASGADADNEIGEWHNPESHLIPLILDAAMGVRDNIKIFGTDYDTPDGTCIRDYIHVTDLADAHILALEHLQKGGESLFFNLGNGNGFSVKEVIEKAREVTGKNITAIEENRRAGDPPQLVGSADVARNTLGWKPKYDSLEYILETAWNWHQKLYKEFKK